MNHKLRCLALILASGLQINNSFAQSNKNQNFNLCVKITGKSQSNTLSDAYLTPVGSVCRKGYRSVELLTTNAVNLLVSEKIKGINPSGSGQIGPQGIPGAVGATGATGPIGPKGKDGQSNFRSAKACTTFTAKSKEFTALDKQLGFIPVELKAECAKGTLLTTPVSWRLESNVKVICKGFGPCTPYIPEPAASGPWYQLTSEQYGTTELTNSSGGASVFTSSYVNNGFFDLEAFTAKAKDLSSGVFAQVVLDYSCCTPDTLP